MHVPSGRAETERRETGGRYHVHQMRVFQRQREPILPLVQWRSPRLLNVTTYYTHGKLALFSCHSTQPHHRHLSEKEKEKESIRNALGGNLEYEVKCASVSLLDNM